ncbi:MAG: zf-HC2 domain-containing protein [Clostridia bacterium]|nr:zf-HC2 domain-containing protein [Clostridia bacterium]
MKNECSVVRDILPLYLENMVSEETAESIKEHLENCPDCAAEFEAMKSGKTVEKIGEEVQSDFEAEVLKSIKNIRKKFRKKVLRVGGIIAAILAAILIAGSVLLHLFPIYRIAQISLNDYYSKDQMKMALYIGSASDREEVISVLLLANKAFNDVRHTRAENEEAYGLLARYATPTDSYEGAAFNEHSLELWSAHLDENEGWIWVYYSSETFDHNGKSICGSWRIPSLWKVEKNEIGEWVVVDIREHP